MVVVLFEALTNHKKSLRRKNRSVTFLRGASFTLMLLISMAVVDAKECRKEAPCKMGEGDCDEDSDCLPGLICDQRGTKLDLLLEDKCKSGEAEEEVVTAEEQAEELADYEDVQSFFSALAETPLAKNPFFIRFMADGHFNGEGTEGIAPDFSGYVCRFMGTLECTDFDFQCTGRGVIDCTGECPGDEDTLEEMMDMMGSATLAKEYPVIAFMKKRQHDRPPKNKAKEREVLVKVYKRCGFDTTLLELANAPLDIQDNDDNSSIAYVAQDAVEGFGAYDYDYYEHEEVEAEPEPEKDSGDVVESEPETEVARSSDHSTQYRNEEAGKRIVQNKDNISEDKDKQYVENNLKNNHMIDNGPKKLKLIDTAATRDEDVPIVNKRQAIDKKNSANKLNQRKEGKVLTKQNKKRSMHRNVPRSVGEIDEPFSGMVSHGSKNRKTGVNFEIRHNSILNERRRRHSNELPATPKSSIKYKTIKSMTPEEVLEELRSEVSALRQTFLIAVNIAEKMGQNMNRLHLTSVKQINSDKTRTNSRTKRNSAENPKRILEKKRRLRHSSTAQTIIERMKNMSKEHIRKIRSVAEGMEVNVVAEEEQCNVRNLSCVAFPTVKQCTGISVGGCMSNTQLLAMLFSPRVIYFVVITIIFLIAGGVGIAVYFCKRRASQIAPEQGEAANMPAPDSERGNQNDCQRAKQVPLNSGGGP